jgi:DNA-binding NtrC family response regulator
MNEEIMILVSEKNIREIKNRFEIVGNSSLLNHAIIKAIKVAPTDISVLITGESGVGKEAFSKIIHTQSKRKHGNFIAINCAAIPEGTIDSELFGHEKGSFTSAYDARKGYFETVNGGTIFLDEISELPLETQSRLLRVLETGEFLKVGSSKVLKTDIRLIAASNKELLELTQQGKFREDLYYRLSTVNIQIPPLRKRKEDIPFLVAKFSNDFADKYKTPPIELTEEAVYLMQNQYWPGNIRQLKNIIEQISILEAERLINAEMLKGFLPETPSKDLVPLSVYKNQVTEKIPEREVLYKFLFDVKSDVTELKALLYDLIHELEGRETSERARLLKAGSPYSSDDARESFYKHEEEIEEHSPVHEEQDAQEVKESLSLIEKEKELVIEALNKHKGRRKPAARELGISERTLYRKIKEYNLENGPL